MIRRIIVVVALILSVALSATIIVANFAEAEGVMWARVVNDGVYVYATEEDDERLFVAEKSYYLQIFDETERMYFVYVQPDGGNFPVIGGYVYKSQVKLCDVPPIRPAYPAEKLTVTSGSAAVRTSPLPSAKTEIAAVNRQTVCYYGSIESYGSVWYYVYYGGKHGYVNAQDVSAPNIALHPTPLPSKPTVALPSDDTVEPVQPPSDPTPASEILLIVFVVVLAVGLTLALFLPGNLKKKNTVFEQDI